MCAAISVFGGALERHLAHCAGLWPALFFE
jgi:hypothetical protein